jgi:hypothetical protein
MGPCHVPPTHDLEVTKTVYTVGLRLGVSDKVMLAGFEAGWVESHMNNLRCGDRDSLGEPPRGSRTATVREGVGPGACARCAGR